MPTTVLPLPRLRPWPVVALAALITMATGCAEDGTLRASGTTALSAVAVPADDLGAVHVALVVGNEEIAAATLADSPTTRDLAVQLPVTVEMEDRFGQAAVGRLPSDLAYVDVGRVLDPAAGHMYYWPLDGSIAVLTADLGPSIPAPGLIDLGVVNTGLEALGSEGNRFEITLRRSG